MDRQQFRLSLQGELSRAKIQPGTLIIIVTEQDGTFETTITFSRPITPDLEAWLDQRFVTGVRVKANTAIINTPNDKGRKSWEGNSIWCLFSVENNYDQPANNLVAWWPTKPNCEVLAETLGDNHCTISKDYHIMIGKLYRTGRCINWSHTEYRLEEKQPGKI